MTGIPAQTEGTEPGQERPAAAPGLAPGSSEGNSAPRIVTAQPGQTVELPFTLAAATVSLRGDDLYLQVGDQLVVIKGYGPALDAGHPPILLDPRGDTLALGLPQISAATPVILTDAPEPQPQVPADSNTANPVQHFGGALLTVFNPSAGSNLRGLRPVGTAGAESAAGSGRAASGVGSEPDFSGIHHPRGSATTTSVIAPFEAKDDNGGVLRGNGSGNVLSGWGAAPDVTTGGTVTKASGVGAPVTVTPAGVDVAGQYGTLHISADGSTTYHRTIGGVADLAALPNGASEVFTYTLRNGDGRTDTAALTVRVMPETVVAGDTIGTDFDEALRFAAGASGKLSGLGGEDRLFGGTGGDTLLGGADNDYLQPGSGNDKVDGGAGDDVLDLAGNLAAADTIIGGTGNDTLLLNGNYAAGVVFAASTLTEVETIQLAAGNSYKLTPADANNALTLTVDGKALIAGNILTLNGAAETSAALIAHGGAGNDALTGGAGMDQLDGGAGNDTLAGNGGVDVLTAGTGNDVLSGGAGNDRLVLAGNLTAADKIDGGADSDSLELDGNYASGITFTATTLANVETISLAAGNSYKLTLADASNTTGLTIDGTALAGGNTLTIIGTAETSATLIASGGAGNDVLTGGAGKDTLSGGAGSDTLTGNNGDDVLIAGGGTDTLLGGGNNDILDLGANLDAADKIDGGANTDTLKLDGDYGAGITFTVTTVVNVETIALAAGHDYKLKLADATNTAGLTVDATALASGNALTLDGSAETASALKALGGAGDDVLIGGAGSDTLTGGIGQDTLVAGAGTDTLSGGAGDDTLILGANLTAGDKIDGGADTDIIKLQGNYAAGVTLTATTIVNVEEIDLAAGNSTKLVLNDANNTSTLTIDGSALLAGQALSVNGAAETASAFLFTGGAGDDVLTGGAGSDTLKGGDGNDTLTTSAGLDVVDGGTGNDTISLAANLTALDQIDGGSGNDTITLNGNYAAGVTLGATTIANVETITLANGFSYKLVLDDATNAAGLTVNGSALTGANALTLDGSAETSAKLTASGGAGNDTLIGGAGDDSLSGGSGNDLLRAGAGIDTLSGGAGNDILELGGNLTVADKIDGGANTDTLKLDGDYGAGLVLSATTVTNVEAIQLATGHDYALTLDNATNAAGLSVDAGALGAADRLVLNGAAETSAALTVLGGSGDDTITGGSGNDLLQGGSGADLLTAGAGNDKLQGGTGDDVLVLGANLTAADQIDGGADTDIVKLSGTYAGLTFGAATLINVEKIELAAGGSYKFTLNDANDTSTLAIDGGALLAGQVLTVNGTAETASALLFTGGAGDDVLTGGAGSDVLKGGDGNDTLTTGAGIDVVDGGIGNDTIVLAANLTALDQIDGGAGNDALTLSGNYSAGLVFTATTVQNVETITLAAGNSYKLTLDDATNSVGLTVNAATLAASAALTLDGSAETSAALTAIGGAGNDTITGGAGDDRITSGAGTDKLSGGAGNDVFILAGNLTAADQIDGGADQDKLMLSGNYSAGIAFSATTLTNVEEIILTAGNSYKLTLNDANDTSTLAIDGSALLAGQVLNVNGAAETGSALLLTGGLGNDALTGGAGSDLLRGGEGNDTLTTGAGNDTVDGGSGNDTIALAGNLTALDQIDGAAGTDTVTLSGDYSAGIVLTATTLQNVETITLAAGNSYKLTLDDASNSLGLAVNAGALAASASMILDGSAETSAALTATGGAGNDTITGGAGSDKITSGAGTDSLSGNAGNDTFVLAGNLTAADKIDGGADQDVLSLSGNYSAGVVFTATTLTNVETITLADGNSYKLTLHDATNAAGLTIDGSLLSATRTMNVDGAAETSASLTATGGSGNDTLTGGGGGDILTGGAGNDTLNGNAGADHLFGGIGNDTLTGGTGADTFHFALADLGKDTVKDFKLAEGDSLEFTQVLDSPGNDIQDLIDAGLHRQGLRRQLRDLLERRDFDCHPDRRRRHGRQRQRPRDLARPAASRHALTGSGCGVSAGAGRGRLAEPCSRNRPTLLAQPRSSEISSDFWVRITISKTCAATVQSGCLRARNSAMIASSRSRGSRCASTARISAAEPGAPVPMTSSPITS